MTPQVPALARTALSYINREALTKPHLLIPAHAPAWVLLFATDCETVITDHWTVRVFIDTLTALSEMSEEDAFINSPALKTMIERVCEPRFTALNQDSVNWMINWQEGELRFSTQDTIPTMDDMDMGDPLELIRLAEKSERELILHRITQSLVKMQTIATPSDDADNMIGVGGDYA